MATAQPNEFARIAAHLSKRRDQMLAQWRRAVGKALSDLRSGVLARGAWPQVLLLSAGALGGYLGLFLVAEAMIA